MEEFFYNMDASKQQCALRLREDKMCSDLKCWQVIVIVRNQRTRNCTTDNCQMIKQHFWTVVDIFFPHYRLKTQLKLKTSSIYPLKVQYNGHASPGVSDTSGLFSVIEDQFYKVCINIRQIKGQKLNITL